MNSIKILLALVFTMALGACGGGSSSSVTGIDGASGIVSVTPT